MASYRPSEVVRITGLSLSSVKNHCKTYAGYLSPGASQVGQTRYFTPDDLRVLAFVAQHSRQGLPRSEIIARLDAGELVAFDWQPPQDAPQQPTDSATTPGQVAMVLINRLSVDLDSARERERELTERLIALQDRASRAEGELAALRSAPPRPGFWTRLFGG